MRSLHAWMMLPGVVLLAAAAVAAEPEPWPGDPYPLLTDPTGVSLADVAEPMVVTHDGRELRFASAEAAEQFAADPAEYLAKVDKQIIEQQAKHYPLDVCVVSGEELGSMGKPIQRVYGNRLVQFCCAGCTRSFARDPAKHIEQLDEAVIAAQSEDYALETCPVSGQELGGMGEPVNYVFANRLVKFCCAGCEKPFKAHVTRHLAALPQPHVERDEASGGEAADGGHEHRDHDH